MDFEKDAIEVLDKLRFKTRILTKKLSNSIDIVETALRIAYTEGREDGKQEAHFNKDD